MEKGEVIMKQTILPKLDLSLKQSLHASNVKSLQILSCSNDELRVFLNETVHQNPFLHYHSKDVIDSDAFLSYAQEGPSLYDEIMRQAETSRYQIDQKVCEYLIFQLDSNGYFQTDLSTLIKQSPFTKEQIKRHLIILRSFEPHGLFAFSLKQCLKIQCHYSSEPASETAILLCEHLEELALHHYESIMDACDISLDELEEGYDFIKTLHPKPGANYQKNTSYMQPEFKVEVIDDHIHIQHLFDDLALSFQSLEGDHQRSEVSEYLKKQRQQALEIMSSIKRRNMTLLLIMQYICEIQKDFFLHQGSLHHLTLEMIAKNCGFHISTISRALANKSFEFHQRYYSLSSMLSHGGYQDHSIKAIQEEIKSIIEHEDKNKPYSDERIRLLLQEKNIHISRRAVTKYRENCFIYNSSKRKQSKKT